jgi:hypothetical protein
VHSKTSQLVTRPIQTEIMHVYSFCEQAWRQPRARYQRPEHREFHGFPCSSSSTISCEQVQEALGQHIPCGTTIDTFRLVSYIWSKRLTHWIPQLGLSHPIILRGAGQTYNRVLRSSHIPLRMTSRCRSNTRSCQTDQTRFRPLLSPRPGRPCPRRLIPRLVGDEQSVDACDA